MINGIINVYKERGFTSHDVVAKLRGILKQKKIGHTGTLDPEAEGVLPVCLGKATKVCDMLTEKDKVYETVLLLGEKTDTQDITGTVLEKREVTCTEEQVKEVIAGFVGTYAQIPPMYSALKVNGKKLCDLARAGIEVERKPREVQIFSIDIEKTGADIVIGYTGDGFLQNMIRIITGTLIEVGDGRKNPDAVMEILASKDRAQAGYTAPACGLRLERVDYGKVVC